MIVRKRGDWLAARVGDEILMMSAEAGLYLGLSAVGARIWELIEAPATTEAICMQLVDEFAVTPETCSAEVDAFLTELVGYRVIELDDAPHG